MLLSEGRYQVNVSGDLSLHGVTRSLTVPAQLAILGDEFRASGEVSLSQTNFGIQPVSVAGGTLTLKDELKFSFNISRESRIDHMCLAIPGKDRRVTGRSAGSRGGRGLGVRRKVDLGLLRKIVPCLAIGC